MLAQLKADYPDDLRVIYRHFPLISIHDKAVLAAVAADAAGLQGQFWAMHDLIYVQQTEWASLPLENFKNWLVLQAGKLDLDMDRFTADIESEALYDAVMTDYNSAVEAGIPGTPFMLINGRIYSGPTDYTNLSVIIDLYSLQKRQYQQCPPMQVDPELEYTATIVTEKGEIVVELLAGDAPLAVNNFVFLAREGYYDDVTFHRVFPGYIAQTGDPSGTGYGGPGYAFVREDNGLAFDRAGILAMDSAANGSQFFITYAPLPSLDGSYTIFGYVIEGLEVLEALTARDPSTGLNQAPGDRIETILINVR